jgi:hypothetical protein
VVVLFRSDMFTSIAFLVVVRELGRDGIRELFICAAADLPIMVVRPTYLVRHHFLL